MVNDKISKHNLYDTYEVKGVVAYRGNFQHPWFFDTYQHRLMKDFSDKYIHLKSLKTGDIFQFMLIDVLPRFRRKGILITSTMGDTVYVFDIKQPSFHKTIHRYQQGSIAKASSTSYSGTVKYGGYIMKQYEEFFKHIKEADIEFSDKSLMLIRDELERRKVLYENR